MPTQPELVARTPTGAAVWLLSHLAPFDNNVYVVVDPDSRECLVVDASEARPIAEAVGRLTLNAVLITHGHRDHHAALAELRTLVPAPVGIGAEDRDLLSAPSDFSIADDQVFTVGRQQVRAIHTPGHTPGSTCFLLDDLLFSGDTLFPGGPGNTNRQTNPYGDFATIIHSLRTRLFTLPDETRVLPGHGAATTVGAERPHLDEWIARGW